MADLMNIHKLQLKILNQPLHLSVVFRINELRCLQDGFAMLAVSLFGGEIPGQARNDGVMSRA